MDNQTARLRDAMRGVMWQRKWRGTLEEYPDQEELRRGATLWMNYLEPYPIQTPDWVYDNPVGIGTYGWKYNPEILDVGISLGARLIDTAETYGYGRAEKAIGEYVRRYVDWGQVWIATKVARNRMSRTAAVAAARRSRERLGVSAIDLYQIHWPPPDGNLEPIMDAMAELLDEGTILRVGVCNFSAGQLATAQALARNRGFQVESNQIRLNQTDPGATEYLLGFCARAGVRVIAYSPLAQGRATGNVAESLRWVLSWVGVAYAIPRTNNLEHLRANLVIGNQVAEGRETVLD